VIKVAAFALLAGGIVLAFFGVNAVDSTSSDISRFFTGAPTDRATWMLVGGVVMLAAGIAGLLPAFEKIRR
jgi:phosphatidylserine synthase